MKKENKIIVSLIILFSLGAVFYCVYLVLNNNNELTDAIKFRSEYMALNDKMNEETEKVYLNVNISETNTVKYATEKEIIDILESGSGLIYFGDATSSWCRSIVSSLTLLAEEKNETIYYFDISRIRTVFELNNEQISIIKEGSETYYKILELLDDYLEVLYLTDELGNHYITNEKVIHIPTLIMVKNGNIVGFHKGTVETQENGYDKLEDFEIADLKEIITNIINSKYVNEVCTMEKC